MDSYTEAVSGCPSETLCYESHPFFLQLQLLAMNSFLQSPQNPHRSPQEVRQCCRHFRHDGTEAKNGRILILDTLGAGLGSDPQSLRHLQPPVVEELRALWVTQRGREGGK